MRENKPTIFTSNLSMNNACHMYHHRVSKSKEIFSSIKFEQRFYFDRFPSWEKITFKVAFHRKRYNLETIIRSSEITIDY